MKKKLLLSVSAIVLSVGAAASAIAADAQNTRINHRVISNNPDVTPATSTYSDNQSLRANSLNDGTFNGATGVGHTMQNNGSNNAVSSADTVALNPQNATRQAGSIAATVGDNTANDLGYVRSNDINGSFNGARGMFSVQQNNGDNNSMAGSNQVLVRTSQDPIATRSESNQSVNGLTNAHSTGSNRQNTIQNGSFNGVRGILNLQQNNGDNNAMAQTNAIAVGINTTSLDQRVISRGTVGGAPPSLGVSAYDEGVTRTNTLNNAFQAAAGVIGIQQNNGNNNVMASTNAVGLTIGGLGEAAQAASLEATVGNAYSIQAAGAVPTTLSNNASGVMTNARGLITLQQNNGNNNVMQSAVMVSANVPRP